MNNCFGYNEKNYMCTICKPPYGERDGMPSYRCYQPKTVKTNADRIRNMTDDELSDWLIKELNDCKSLKDVHNCNGCYYRICEKEVCLDYLKEESE